MKVDLIIVFLMKLKSLHNSFLNQFELTRVRMVPIACVITGKVSSEP